MSCVRLGMDSAGGAKRTQECQLPPSSSHDIVKRAQPRSTQAHTLQVPADARDAVVVQQQHFEARQLGEALQDDDVVVREVYAVKLVLQFTANTPPVSPCCLILLMLWPTKPIWRMQRTCVAPRFSMALILEPARERWHISEDSTCTQRLPANIAAQSFQQRAAREAATLPCSAGISWVIVKKGRSVCAALCCPPRRSIS